MEFIDKKIIDDFDDIIQDLKDDFICDYDMNAGIDDSDKIYLSVYNNESRPMVWKKVIPYLEEIIDRCLEIGLKAKYVYVDGNEYQLGTQYTSIYDIEDVEYQIEIWFEKTLEEGFVLLKKDKTKFQKVKSFLGFNESLNRDRHTDKYLDDFDDIIQDLKDDFECKYDVENEKIYLSIFNTTNRPMVWESVLPYLEEIIDRCEDINLTLEVAWKDGTEYSRGARYNSIYDINQFGMDPPEHQIELVFGKTPLIFEPGKNTVTKFQKIKNFLGFNESRHF